MKTTRRVLKYELHNVVRSRAVLVYTVFLFLLTDVLFRFGGEGPRVVLSLLNVVLLFVPLVSVVFGTMYVYSAREFTELLLAQPVGRRSLFAGLYLGLALPLAGAFLAGVGLPVRDPRETRGGALGSAGHAADGGAPAHLRVHRGGHAPRHPASTTAPRGLAAPS